MKQITPYLIFDGNCREAMNFYKQCIGGALTTTTFGAGDPNARAEAKDRLMHARLERRADVADGIGQHAGDAVHPGR